MSTIVQPRCGVKVRARRRHCVLGWNDDDDDAMERKEIFRRTRAIGVATPIARVDGRTEVGWNGMEWKRARPPCSRNERIAETRKGTRRRRTTNDGCVDNKLFVFLFTRGAVGRPVAVGRSVVRSFVRGLRESSQRSRIRRGSGHPRLERPVVIRPCAIATTPRPIVVVHVVFLLYTVTYGYYMPTHFFYWSSDANASSDVDDVFFHG